MKYCLIILFPINYHVDGQCPGLAPQEMNQSVCTAERLADSLSSHLIHLRDRWITAGSQSSATTTTQSGSGVDTTTRPSSAENSHSSPHRHTLSSSSGEGKTKGNSMNIDDGSQSKQSSNSTDDNKELSSQNISETNATDTTSTISSSSSNSSSATTGCLVKEYLLRRKTASDDFVDVRYVSFSPNITFSPSLSLIIIKCFIFIFRKRYVEKVR